MKIDLFIISASLIFIISAFVFYVDYSTGCGSITCVFNYIFGENISLEPPIGPSAIPTIVQVTPIGMKILITQTADVLVTVYGNDFDTANARLKIDGNLYTGPTFVQSSQKILISIPSNLAKIINEIVVVNGGGEESKPFYIKDTTFRAPDLIDIDKPIITSTDSEIVIKGHNFFDTNSMLYVDGVLIPSNGYSLTKNVDNSFTLRLPLQGVLLSEGIHTVHFDNPSRYPGLSYGRFQSNQLYYSVVSFLDSDFSVENSGLRLIFEGDRGTLKGITNKMTGRIYPVKNIFPWRLEVREIRNPNSLTLGQNPLLPYPLINPFNAGCLKPTHVLTSNSIVLTWANCKIGAQTFSVEQTYTLSATSQTADVNLRIIGSPQGYGLHAVRQYLTFADTSAREWGLTSTRSIEIFEEPFSNLPSRGSREVCDTNNPNTDFPCNTFDPALSMPDSMLDTDGDGFNVYNFLEAYTAIWDDDGEYLFAFPVDDISNAKQFAYQGSHNLFKATVISYVSDSYSPLSFNYQTSVPIRIGVGKGTKFTGNETWVNVADEYANIQKSIGNLVVPFDKRTDVPDFLKGLDVYTVAQLQHEIYD